MSINVCLLIVIYEGYSKVHELTDTTGFSSIKTRLH